MYDLFSHSKTFTLSQSGKKDINATVTQDKKEWTYSDFETNANGLVSAKLTAGSWDGAFNFAIELTDIEDENVELISFNIDGTAYQAVKGSTFGDWLDSKYGTEKYYFGRYFGESYLYNSETDMKILDSSTNDFVPATLEIVEAGDYYTNL